MPIYRLENLAPFQAINVLSDPGSVGGPVVIPNLVQIRLNWNLAGSRTAHNVLYGRVGGVPAPSVAQAQAIFVALSSGAQWTALAAVLSTGAGLASVTLKSVHEEGLAEFQSTGTVVLGTDATQPLPNETAICVTLRTGLTGPSNRGRLYLGGFCASSLATGNVIAPGTVTAATNWAATISGALSAQGYTWVLGLRARQAYTGSTGTAHPARPATSVPVSSALVRNNTWDSQRRRGLK